MKRRTILLCAAAGVSVAGALAAMLDRDAASGGVTVVPGRAPSSAPAPTAPAVVAAPRPSTAPAAVAADTNAVTITPVATLRNPWAMVFLPDGRLLVTEKLGTMRVVTAAGAVGAPLTGLPRVAAGGQGGLLDVALDPAHPGNRRVWWTYAEAGSGGSGLAVARGTLTIDAAGNGRVDDVAIAWRQAPRVPTEQHFGGRLAFAPDGKLFVTAGERKQGAPAQAQGNTLGKIVRIDPAGGRAEIWTLGHRNPYGLVFAQDGRLFESEMGPEGGDEFNLIIQRRNYGWPSVSEGNQYGGAPIPRHTTDPRFTAPLVAWTPVIAPGGMIQYRGTVFTGWSGDFVLAGLAAQAIVRVRPRGWRASEVGRIVLGARIREVEEGPDGALWVLEDGAAGRLLRLDPA